MAKPEIANVLASRYASAQLADIWSPRTKIAAERRLWIAVMTAQRELGIDIPDGVIDDYTRVVDEIDLTHAFLMDYLRRTLLDGPRVNYLNSLVEVDL